MENIKRVTLRHKKDAMKTGWLFILLLCGSATAQDKLTIAGKGNDLHVLYPATGNESLQQISSRFGLSVNKLSQYNGINVNANTPFAKGTQVKIPVTRDILLQQPGENSAPVYHIIHKGDNLYRLSILYNKVSIASLRSWNHLKKDIVKDGQPLIIGYMVNAAAPVIASETKKPVVKDVDASVTQTPVQEPGKIYSDKKTIPAPVAVKKDIVPAAEKKEESKPVVKETVAENKQPVTITPKEEKKTVLNNTESEYSPKDGDEGFYAIEYAATSKDRTQQYRTGDAATFKTISGWTDRKFYVLMNDVAPKTVVRITGPTQKSICAVVLGPLQETKGAAGILLRVSNSAAAALGITDQKFTVALTYFE